MSRIITIDRGSDTARAARRDILNLAVARQADEDLYGDEVALMVEHLQIDAEQTERLAELIDGAVTLVLGSRRVELAAGVDPVALTAELEEDAEKLLRRHC